MKSLLHKSGASEIFIVVLSRPGADNLSLGGEHKSYEVRDDGGDFIYLLSRAHRSLLIAKASSFGASRFIKSAGASACEIP
jgi:hypothetical protein